MLKANTAVNLAVLMTDSSDHVTGKTGLTLTITLSKDAGAFASITPTVTELASGWYKLALTTSHTDTLGDLALHITATGADPCDLLCRVVAVDHADAAAFGLSRLDATVGSRSTYAGTDTAGTTTLLGRLTGPRGTNLDNLDATISSRSTYAGTDTAGTTTLLARVPAAVALAGSAPSWYTAPVDVSANVSAVKAKTDNLPADPASMAGLASAHGAGSWATATGFALPGDAMALTTATGNALVAGVALAITTDHGAGSYLRNSEPDNTTLAHLATALELDGSVYRFTVNALEQAPAGGGGGGVADWTDAERQQIRRALGISGASATTSGAGLLDVVYARVAAAGATVTVAGVVPSAGGPIPIVRGDDYQASDGRALLWSSTSGLDLGSATVTLSLYASIDLAGAVLTTSPVTVTGVAGAWTLSADLSATQTALLNQYRHALEIIAVLSSGHVVTLLQGSLKVSD